MVDDTTPVPAATPAVEAPARRLWPYFVGGGILVLMAFVAGAVILMFTLFATAASPATTVTEFDRAFAEADCGLFQKNTTTAFQDSFFGEAFTCAPWEENAKGLQVDGTYSYSVVVGETTINGDTADVRTTESDSSSEPATTYDLDYHLVKSDGAWLIDSIENVTSN